MRFIKNINISIIPFPLKNNAPGKVNAIPT